jgi:transposase
MPVVVRSVAAFRPVVDRTESPASPVRRRTNQERIDAAEKLRRKGISFEEIAARLACSERTARRIAGHVQPELKFPDAKSERDTDPRELRETLLARFFDRLYHNRQLRSVTIIWRTDGTEEESGPPTSRFLNLAEGQLRKRLAELGLYTLRCLAVDPELQTEFLRDTIGALFGDYYWWHRPTEELYVGIRGSNGELWRPPWERPADEQPGFIYLLELDI